MIIIPVGWLVRRLRGPVKQAPPRPATKRRVYAPDISGSPPKSFAEGKARWEALGYAVEGLCPECQHGYIVRKGDDRSYCTAYGQCEMAPGSGARIPTRTSAPPVRKVFLCVIRGVLARSLGGGHVDEIGPAAITLTSDGRLHLERAGQAKRTIKIDQVAGLSRGDSSNDPEPAGSWVSIDLKSKETWILIWIDPAAQADTFCSAYATCAAQLGISTSRTA